MVDRGQVGGCGFTGRLRMESRLGYDMFFGTDWHLWQSPQTSAVLPLKEGSFRWGTGRSVPLSAVPGPPQSSFVSEGLYGWPPERNPFRCELSSFRWPLRGIPKLLGNGIPACDESGPNDACTIRLLLQSPAARRDYVTYLRVCIADVLGQSSAPADLRQTAPRTLESPQDSLLFHNAFGQMLQDDGLDPV